MNNETVQVVNIVLAFAAIMLLCAVAFVRESISALELLSNWASARAWGLKCAKRQMEEFEKNRTMVV